MAVPMMMKLISLLLLSATASIASSVLDRRQTGQTRVIFGRPVYNNGNYVFVGCLQDEANALIRLFSQTGIIISNTVVPAVTVPTKDPAQDPFLIFFTNDDQRHTVQNVFRDISSGATKTQSGNTITRPMFVCVNDQSGPYIREAVEFCKGRKAGIAFTLNGSIWLCPSFFTSEKSFPDPKTNCPTVNYAKNSAIYSDHSGVTESQFAVIMHELAHIYTPHPIFGTKEVYDINIVCYSKPDFQLNNPSNYVYYAMSVWLGCRNYPYIPRGDRSYTPKGSKRQVSTSGLTNDSIPIINPERYEIDDVPASTIPGFDIAELQANLTAFGYNLP